MPRHLAVNPWTSLHVLRGPCFKSVRSGYHDVGLRRFNGVADFICWPNGPNEPPGASTSQTMRVILLAGRHYFFQSTRSALSFRSKTWSRSFASSRSLFVWRNFATPRFRGRKLLWSGATGAALSPIGFITLSKDESENGDITQEEAMLAASRKELREEVPNSLQNSKRIRRGIYFFIDAYIVEPIATGLRFLHLVLIFTPVLITIPVIWLGKRQPNRDNERSGTLWWYAFLVRSMERAGAAFIKVMLVSPLPRLPLTPL